MTACEVLVWKNGTFSHSQVFVGDERGPSVAPLAEAYFKEQVKELLQESGAGWQPADFELDNAIEDGYFCDSDSDIEVIITWPTVVHVNTTLL